MDGLTYRGYEAGDFEAMFRLDELCFDSRFRFSRKMMKRFAEAKNGHVVIAEAGGRIVAFCIVHLETLRSERVGYVVTLDVAAECRRQGIGEGLMLQAEAQARNAKRVAMILHVFSRNTGAIRFYEHQGFLLAGRSEGFYGVGTDGEALDALLYRKELTRGEAC